MTLPKLNLSAQQQLVWDAELSCGVLGRGKEFLLIPLNRHTSPPVDDSTQGFVFAGVLGLIRGEVVAVCEPKLLAMETMIRASVAFARQLHAPAIHGDSVQFLERLYALLADTRD